MGNLGLKKGQNEVLCHFLGWYALVFTDFAYDVRYLWYSVDTGKQGGETKIAGSSSNED